MIFNADLKDSLIVTREGRRRRSTRFLLLLLAVCAALAAVFWTRFLAEREQAVPIEPEAPMIIQENVAPIDPGMQLLGDMQSLAEKGELLRSREIGYEILEKSKDASALQEAERLLGRINIELILTPKEMQEKASYLVKSGDSLDRIAKAFNTTVELIKKGNNLDTDMIHPGDTLRVFNGTFLATISKSRNDLVLTMNDRFFKRYSVGTGKHGTTPTGIFQISDKIVEPPWWRPDGKMVLFGDPENVLGTRWMSITAIEGTEDVRGYGIHGTWEPETIGQQSSQGCVRMHNSDVEELHMLLPVGTRVTIVE